jgi:hypothetical protein
LVESNGYDAVDDYGPASGKPASEPQMAALQMNTGPNPPSAVAPGKQLQVSNIDGHRLWYAQI